MNKDERRREILAGACAACNEDISVSYAMQGIEDGEFISFKLSTVETAMRRAEREAAKDAANHHREHFPPCNCCECLLFDALTALEQADE